MNRRKLLLVVLLGALALALAYAFFATPRQQRVTETGGKRQAKPRSSTPAQKAAPAEDNRLRLELLTRQEAQFPGFKRDIFRTFSTMPSLPPPPPLPTLPLPTPPPPPVMEAPPIPVEVQQELAKFTFLGFLLKDGTKTIFLASGDEIFLVKRGDRFGNKKEFLVTDLSPERLTIVRQGEDNRPLIVPLVEQAPLVPAQGGAPAAPARSYARPFRPRVPAQSQLPTGIAPEPLPEPGASEIAPVPGQTAEPEINELPFPVDQTPAGGDSPPPEQVPGEVPNE